MGRVHRSNLLALACGALAIGCFIWAATEGSSPPVYKTHDGRPFVCNPTLLPEELDEARNSPIAERGQAGNCAFIDKFAR